nr:hypothetical protein [Tanacetum cinerariifolium]
MWFLILFLVVLRTLLVVVNLKGYVDNDLGANRQHDGKHRPPSFASFIHEESGQRKVNFHTLEIEQSDLADVLIPMSSILKVQARFKNTLYGTYFCMWIIFHGVPALEFNADGLSAIATHLSTLVMLDSCTVTTCVQSWGRIDYARALVDIRADRALKDTMVILVSNRVGNGVTMHNIKVEYEWKPLRCVTYLVHGHDDVQCPNGVIVDLRNLGKQG